MRFFFIIFFSFLFTKSLFVNAENKSQLDKNILMKKQKNLIDKIIEGNYDLVADEKNEQAVCHKNATETRSASNNQQARPTAENIVLLNQKLEKYFDCRKEIELMELKSLLPGLNVVDEDEIPVCDYKPPDRRNTTVKEYYAQLLEYIEKTKACETNY